MEAGQTVYYKTGEGARFGYFIEAGYKWARVRVAGSVKRVPLADVMPWPPVQQDTTNTKNVKRK
jgi:hypothetical protein